ncbi:MAG TPA: antitoxin Xre/MbcA/ParS toxin-binding domain-containing protein [Gemmatimonadales bacterium]|jgi:putative toxin-antitoxin system antitoxin component (TIGR02293 family)|nr:antitoxin Xre/MbcA/ParS toxin-binding domain-containing protein [Gemmatimonadales bacterium]
MTAAAVAAKLGGRRALKQQIRSEMDLVALVREGLPVAALDFFVRYLAAGDLYRIVGSARTLQRKRAAGERLSAEESDRLARVARMFTRAEEALGSEERSTHWLRQANRALGGARPVDLLDSDAGTVAVERVLGRIEHGVYS